MELSLNSRLVFVPKTISQFLEQVSKIKDESEKLSKLEDYLKRFEEERGKIDAFKRELPLCTSLVNNGGLYFYFFCCTCVLVFGRWVFDFL